MKSLPSPSTLVNETAPMARMLALTHERVNGRWSGRQKS
jgi:hypothetical protein